MTERGSCGKFISGHNPENFAFMLAKDARKTGISSLSRMM